MRRHWLFLQSTWLFCAMFLVGCCECTFDREFAKAAQFNDTADPAVGTWTGTWKVTGAYVGEPAVQPARAALLIGQDKRLKVNLDLRTPVEPPSVFHFFSPHTHYQYNWVAVLADVRQMRDGSEAFAGHGNDLWDPIIGGEWQEGTIVELFGAAKNGKMHISISFYFDALYMGPRNPYYHGEIDLQRVRLPPSTKLRPDSQRDASAP